MNEIAASLSPTSSLLARAEPGEARRRPDANADAPGFSYALAAASLESGAAQSLKAHGATRAGEGAAPTARPAAADADRAASPSRTTTPTTSAETAPDQSARPAPPHQHAPNPHQNAAPAQIAVAATVATVLSSPAASATAKTIDAIAARDAASAEKAKAAATKPARAAEPAILKPEFAEILARRLEKTSVFDLRLDPPELGRVEGRLTIGEDGKSVLSLSFDNESAFDLYSRDQQALRQALSDAGLEFAADQFRFSYRAPQQEGAGAALNLSAASDSAGRYDPVFFAQWSAGALDIRI